MNDEQLQTGKPIIFSAESVRAIYAGRKTQTRRVLKPQPQKCQNGGWIYNDQHFADDVQMQSHLFHNVYGGDKCPYGGVYSDGSNDLLWVRETWLEMDRDGWCDPSKPKWWFDDCYNRVNAIAYRVNCDAESEKIRREYGYKWRSPIYMPRWASRITLRVTDVRVERVQDISEADAVAEGAERGGSTPRHAFMHLWDSVNAKRGYPWDHNPWVWVVEFEKVQR